MIEVILFLILIAVAVLFGLFMQRDAGRMGEKSSMASGPRKGKSVRFDESRNEVFSI
jgi:hypothetical protein